MRAQQRNRLIWNLEQIVSTISAPVGAWEDRIKDYATIALKIARDDEAKYAGRVPPIRPRKRA